MSLGLAAGVSETAALAACAAMAVFYVAILYSPALLGFPAPASLHSFLIRRFACALVSSLLSVLFSSLLLGVGGLENFSSFLRVYGIRNDRAWQAVVFPLCLTSLLYAGSFVAKALLLACEWKRSRADSRFGDGLFGWVQRVLDGAKACACNILAWRNYVVAPITEELVFRSCMIPLLLCGGFKTYSIIFFSPIFFSLGIFLPLAILSSILAPGVQLGYTVIFGWYASFLFIRTGNLIAPIVAHIFCNVMGLPMLSSSRTKGMTTIAFAAGVAGFLRLLFPATSPVLYNERTDDCSCWHDYCHWK